MTQNPGTLAEAKKQAKLLRAKLSEDGHAISHSKSLELVAQQQGHRDWNAMFASFGNQTSRVWQVGDRVSGRYLSQAFEAEIIAVKQVTEGWYRLTFKFDEAVDVVTFDSFSAFRQRVSATVGPQGTTREKTSNGQPQLVLDL
ncbi:glyoxalase superfamily protein [Cohaesibacter celericrescens]|uniref:Glyoxalase-related protein domain-containing protein n=1 Tax=Cohaesibacter celericrescens TaxID=2067669 RepID=A0A2N5XWS3_9HYPH|nr:glyoxalase superfamily protein [Cohaesibacter celericrescens]PLW75557.1 hypothetical protein C0081_19675 [Cohaesibacter celericrescens]PLW78964.1 hypothetical protein C0081_01635 [Cohaesibacter celericrescens]